MGRRVSKSGQINKSQSLISCAQERQQDINKTIIALEAFAGDATLTGAAYSSAKDYVKNVLSPVGKVLWGALEDEISSNKTVIDCCNTYLAGVDLLDEDMICAEINRLQNQIYSLEISESIWVRLFSGSIKTSCYTRINELNEELKKLNDFDGATQSAHSNLCDQINFILQKTNDSFSSNLFLDGQFFWSGIDMNWTRNRTRRWDAYNELITGHMQAFLEGLPSELGKTVSLGDIRTTDDGFVICTKPLEEIMADLHIPINKTEVNPIDISDYDDWYLVGLVGQDNTTTYTLVKMREPGDKQGASGSALPFISLNIENCSAAIEKISTGRGDSEAYKIIEDEIANVVYQKGTENAALRDYFADPKSDGSYLLADCIVEKVVRSNFVQNEEGYIWQLSLAFEKNDEYARAYLDELSQLGVYDKDNNSIRISRLDSLNKAEYNAVLTATTGNIDAYSFAAENQWHAEALLGEHWPWSIDKDSAIKSDAGVGESSLGFLYEADFKSVDGTTYKEQKQYHE